MYQMNRILFWDGAHGEPVSAVVVVLRVHVALVEVEVATVRGIWVRAWCPIVPVRSDIVQRAAGDVTPIPPQRYAGEWPLPSESTVGQFAQRPNHDWVFCHNRQMLHNRWAIWIYYALLKWPWSSSSDVVISATAERELFRVGPP